MNLPGTSPNPDRARSSGAACDMAVSCRHPAAESCPQRCATTGDRSRSGWAEAVRVGERAFTMVEIALSLAIIGIGMIAIIGVLPRGLKVQRENREETIISQDATVWLNAIRSGARGYDDLTNYVDAITNIVTEYDRNGNVIEGPHRFGYTWSQCTFNTTELPPIDVITNGYRIVGLLTTPRFTYYDLANQIIHYSNHVTAYVHAMSGSASEKSPQTNTSVRELAFSYRIVSEVVPYVGWDTNMAQFLAPGLTSDEIAARSNAWLVARSTHENLYDIRLLFRWPLLPKGRTGQGRQAFRASATGVMSNDPPYYFFNPRTYVRNPNP